VDTFVARQPIFDKEQEVYAYELLFRASMDNYFVPLEEGGASFRLIADGTLLTPLESLTRGKRIYLNVTRDLLLGEFVTLLPREYTVVEILETINPDDEVIAACKRLKEQGYELALDDFVYSKAQEPLIDLADIIKVDFQDTSPGERRALVQRLRGRNVRFLAEKVEVWPEFRQAIDLGYEYFQGYFFSRPEVLRRSAPSDTAPNYHRLFGELQRPELDFGELESVIKNEASLTFRLLRYVNSAFFGWRNKISSIR